MTTLGIVRFRSDEERVALRAGHTPNARRIEARREQSELRYEARAAARVRRARTGDDR